MNALLPDIDPDGLLEFSVVYTDRALNHMSRRFQAVMTGIAGTLKQVYHAPAAVLVPGSGTFGMEAVARQFATGRRALVLRNGLFSYRWSRIFEMGAIPAQHRVLQARRTGPERQSPWMPAPIAEVLAAIDAERPDLVIAAHVETASGILLPDEYLRALAGATHEAGGLLVLDAIASGCLWVDMEALGIDVLLSAPQKGWSGSPCCAMVMLSERALGAMAGRTSSSFACDLQQWSLVMDAYLRGGYAYHTTLPTDALARLWAAMREMASCGFEDLRAAQVELGARVRALFTRCGLASVAAPGFQAPGVVVCHTTDPELQSGRKFLGAGLRIAAGVPLKCDEPDDFMSFRIGLFGLDKLRHLERTVGHLEAALQRIGLG